MKSKQNDNTRKKPHTLCCVNILLIIAGEIRKQQKRSLFLFSENTKKNFSKLHKNLSLYWIRDLYRRLLPFLSSHSREKIRKIKMLLLCLLFFIYCCCCVYSLVCAYCTHYIRSSFSAVCCVCFCFNCNRA